MRIKNIDHIGINVDDLPAAKAFFLDFGLEVIGKMELAREWLDRIVGLAGVHTAAVMMHTPDGQANIELIKYYAPPADEGVQPLPANALGIRHLAFVVEDIDALVARLHGRGTTFFSEVQTLEGYKLCYCRGPEGIILELAEELHGDR